MSDEVAPEKKLTNKQRIFIDEYLRSFNATRAAIKAGYSEKTAYNIGWENVRKPEIKAEIERRLDEAHLSKGEVLQRLSDMASADIGAFMDVSSVGWNIDLLQRDENGDPILDQNGKVIRRPETKLIKKIKQRVTTIIGKKDQDDKEIIETEIELYDAQAALEKLGRYHGLFVDKVALQNPDGSPIKPERDDEKFNRAVEGLAKAIGTALHNPDDGGASPVDATK